MELFAAKYPPLAASSYNPTTENLKDKHSILNIVNTDQKWQSLLGQKHKVEGKNNNANRASHYAQNESEIKLGNV